MLGGAIVLAGRLVEFHHDGIVPLTAGVWPWTVNGDTNSICNVEHGINETNVKEDGVSAPWQHWFIGQSAVVWRMDYLWKPDLISRKRTKL